MSKAKLILMIVPLSILLLSGFSLDKESYDESSQLSGKTVKIKPDIDRSLYDRYKAEWCGFGRQAIYSEARYGDGWLALSQSTQAQILKLEELSTNIRTLRDDFEALDKETKKNDLNRRQYSFIRNFQILVLDAHEARIFRSSDELPKFTIPQIRYINDLPLKESIDIDELEELGLLKNESV